jgi:hypothetical protein
VALTTNGVAETAVDLGLQTGDSPTFANITATGMVTAREFHTQFVSASIVYQSGSTKFGDTSDDVHSFTGSIHLINSGSVSGSQYSTGSFGRFEGSTLQGTIVTPSQTNITSVGTIGTGTWEGTTVAVDQGGTGATTLNDLITLTTHTTGNYVKKVTVGTGLGGAVDSEGGTAAMTLDAAQTQITSLLATDIKIGEDDQTKIDFETADTIHFYAGNENQLVLTDGALTPASNAIVDLGTDALEFKDAYFDGTVEADAITIGGSNIVSGGVITTVGTISSGTWEGTTVAVAQGGTGVTTSTGTGNTVLSASPTFTGTIGAAAGTFSGNITMADDTSIGISDSDERIEFDGAGDISLLGANVGIGATGPRASRHGHSAAE